MQIPGIGLLPELLTNTKRLEYHISKEQEQNLRKLAIGLENLLPTHEHLFDMGVYANDTVYEKTKKATIKHPCQTSACAVGFGPSCGIPFVDYKDSFWRYSEKVFGGVGVCDDVIDDDERDYNYEISASAFMFSPGWSVEQENKPISQMKEAIARIKIVLAGKIPDSFDYTELYT